jgi:hypothetical protein
MALLAGPGVELRRVGQREAIQERAVICIHGAGEQIEPVLAQRPGDQRAHGCRVRLRECMIQTDRVIHRYQHIWQEQRAPELGQQHGEVAARGRIGAVGPEQKAKLLARDWMRCGGDAVKQGARLTARDYQVLVAPHQCGRPQQADIQSRFSRFSERQKLGGQ